jgi:hypothetical protein
LEELAAQDAELSRRQAALDAMAAQLKEQVKKGGMGRRISPWGEKGRTWWWLLVVLGLICKECLLTVLLAGYRCTWCRVAIPLHAHIHQPTPEGHT